MKLEDAIIEIKRRIDIGQVIGQSVRLQKHGHNLLGLCPFHDEKTPSFNVRSDRGYFKCFGCGAAGDVFEFIQRHSGQLFMDVVRDLAAKAGVMIDPASSQPLDPQRAQQREDERAILAIEHENFQKNMFAYRGEHSPLTYMLGERKFTREQIAKLEIGYGGNTGFFARRIVIPIKDSRGRLVGFGGRAFGPTETTTAKYINSPSSMLYDKSRLLYGLYESLPLMKQGKPLALVEGYFDVLALHDVGVGAVAPCGTSLTASHVELLGKYTRRVVLCLDQDAAGRAAHDKALLMLLKAGFQVHAARIDGKDPDTLWRAGKKEALKASIERAPDAVEFRIQELSRQNFIGVADRIQAITQLLPFLCASQNGLINREYIRVAARVLQEDENILLKEVAKIATPGVLHMPKTHKRVSDSNIQPGWTEAEKLLLRAVWNYPHLVLGTGFKVWSGLNQELRDFLAPVAEKSMDIKQVPVARDSMIVKLLIEFEKMEGMISEDEARGIVRDFSLQAELKARKERIVQNQAQLRAAESQGDFESVRKALLAQTETLNSSHRPLPLIH